MLVQSCSHLDLFICGNAISFQQEQDVLSEESIPARKIKKLGKFLCVLPKISSAIREIVLLHLDCAHYKSSGVNSVDIYVLHMLICANYRNPTAFEYLEASYRTTVNLTSHTKNFCDRTVRQTAPFSHESECF